MQISRRELVVGGGLLMASGLMAQPVSAAPQPLARLAVTSVAFRQWFAGPPPFGGGPKPARLLTLMDFPRFVAEEVGLPQVEFEAGHFTDTSDIYFEKLRRAVEVARSKLVNVQLDVSGYDLASTDPVSRARSIEVVKKWIDRAVMLGSPSLRPNMDDPTPGRPFNPAIIIDSFRQLTEYGQRRSVKILSENHSGYSRDIRHVVEVVNGVNDPNCQTLSDWGNSDAPDTQGRIADLSLMFPRLGLVSAKGLHFDSEYRHIDYDIAAIVRATEASGYRGYYSVELYVPTLQEAPADPIRAVRSMADTISQALGSRI